MTFNTGNNVPSTDPRDLYDNAENLDKLVNGADPFYADRLGVLRESWAGMENAFTLSQADKESRFQAFLVSSGYVSKGDYAANVVLEERNEYVAVDAATTGTSAGTYRPNASATLPLTLTGTWSTDSASLVLLGDDALRQDLANDSGSGGTSMVGMRGEGTLQNWINRSHGLTASQLGLVSGTDYTNLFNGALKDRILAEAITEIILDTGNITVSGTLDYAYNRVTFSGEGKIVGTSDNNALQRIPAEKTADKSFPSLITAGLFRNERAYNAIRRQREIRIVLLGDSISVGSDYVSDAVPPAGAQKTSGVDNESVDNSFAKMLFNEICALVPTGTRVKFYSRSIGGLNYSQLDQPWDTLSPGAWTGREAASPGKSWRDCVIDLDPDLVIHSMGMNHSPGNYIPGFGDKWHSYLTSKFLVGTFDQVILTTPNPNFETALQFGDFRTFQNNASKFYVAAQQRFISRHYSGYSLVDIAALSYIKRYGIDPRSCTMEKDAHQLVNAVLSRTQTSSAKHPESPLYHLTEFTFNPSISSSQPGTDYAFEVGSVVVQFTGGRVYVYPDLSNAALYVNSVSYVLQAGISTNIKVSILPSGVFVYVNGEQILYNKLTAFTDTISSPRFRNRSTVECNLTVTSARVFAQQFPRYAVDTRNDEIFGKLDWTINKFGGGVNHPSSVGLAEIYLPPVREYLNKLVNEPTSLRNVQPPSIGTLVYVGTVPNLPFSKSTLRESSSGVYITVSRVAGGAISVDNRSSNTVRITASGAVYVAVEKGDSFYNLIWEGAWLCTGPTYYAGAASSPIGTAVPPSTSVNVVVSVEGVSTVVGQYLPPAGEAVSVISPSLPARARVIYAAGSVAINSGGVVELSLVDVLNVFTDTSAVHFRVVYDTTQPTNLVARRVLFEYRYTLTR